MFIAALFTIAKTWKQPKCPSTEEWIKKMWYIYTMEYYSAIKREWNNAICSNMDGPRDYLTKWNHTHVRLLGEICSSSFKEAQRKGNHILCCLLPEGTSLWPGLHQASSLNVYELSAFVFGNSPPGPSIYWKLPKLFLQVSRGRLQGPFMWPLRNLSFLLPMKPRVVLFFSFFPAPSYVFICETLQKWMNARNM